MYQQELKNALKEKGFSLTKTRRVVFDLLVNQEPQSVQVLVSRAADRVDRSTIYRTLSLFEQLGIIHRLNTGWKYKVELTDRFSPHHHHLHCLNCRGVFILPESPMLETMINKVATRAGFEPSSHQLEIYGLCGSCQTDSIITDQDI